MKFAELCEDLDKWFDEKWVDIGRKKKDGSHPECGRSDADSGKYPKCVPKSKAKRMSAEEKKSATRRKRRDENKNSSSKPTNTKTFKDKKST